MNAAKITRLENERIVANGKEYFLFGEYTAYEGSSIGIYFEMDGSGVIVARNDEILARYFDKVTVFGFIEDTITRKGFDLLVSGAEEYLQTAMEHLGPLPLCSVVCKWDYPGFSLKAVVACFFRGAISGLTLEDVEDLFVPAVLTEDMDDDLPTACFAQETNDGFEVNVYPAEVLPEGWRWEQWDDGSGSLVAPDGKMYYGYDLGPYMGHAVEYRDPNAANKMNPWTVFWGDFDSFKAFAEQKMAASLA